MQTEEEKLINRRAIAMPPKDSVLFLFNVESENNFNMADIEVRPIEYTGDSGRTMVTMKGLSNKGLSGSPSAKGTARFIYRRTDLATIGISSNGSFFDGFDGEPTFIASIEEFKRRTGMNCSKDDFDESAFYPDTNGERRLKAAPDSFRFYGTLNLGRPRRDILGEAITMTLSAGFESYNNAFFLNVDRLGLRFDYSHRFDVINSLTVGQSINQITHPLVDFLIDHMRRKDIQCGFSLAPFSGVNLYGMQVVYKGVVRPTDGVPLNDRDRILAIKLRPQREEWGGGEIRLFYSSTRTLVPPSNPANITCFSLVEPRVWTEQVATLINSLQVGQKLNQIMAPQRLETIFQTLLGVSYDHDTFGELMVVFKGNNRPQDQLPPDVLTCQVVELVKSENFAGAASSPLKLLYRV